MEGQVVWHDVFDDASLEQVVEQFEGVKMTAEIGEKEVGGQEDSEWPNYCFRLFLSC